MLVARTYRRPDGSSHTRATSVSAFWRLMFGGFLIYEAWGFLGVRDWQVASLFALVAAWPVASGLHIMVQNLRLKAWP